MPRYRRRRPYRRSSFAPLLALLLVAIILLLVAQTGRTFSLNLPDLPRVNLPDLPNISIPITGLPEVQIPSVRIPVTVQPGTLAPGIDIAGTPAPAGAVQLGARTKTSGCQIQGGLPDPACSPGAVMSSDADEVCRSGYGAEMRGVTQRIKDQVYEEYGITDTTTGQYQVDHLIPLSLGGSNDIANLWPQPASPAPGFPEKDAVENDLQDRVCSGQMTLAEAQQAIASNWIAVYNQMSK